MNIKIWDTHNKQWLEPMAIYFGRDNQIWKVDAITPGSDPLSDGWYDLRGEDLDKIAITGDITLNPHLMVKVKENVKK
jgi:hypothetical protein